MCRPRSAREVVLETEDLVGTSGSNGSALSGSEPAFSAVAVMVIPNTCCFPQQVQSKHSCRGMLQPSA